MCYYGNNTALMLTFSILLYRHHERTTYISNPKFKWKCLTCLIKTPVYCDQVVSDLLQVGGFLQVLQIPPPIKLTDKI